MKRLKGNSHHPCSIISKGYMKHNVLRQIKIFNSVVFIVVVDGKAISIRLKNQRECLVLLLDRQASIFLQVRQLYFQGGVYKLKRPRNLSANASMFKLILYPPENEYCGRLYSIYQNDFIKCADLGDVLIKLNQLCDEYNFPMGGLRIRTFERKGNSFSPGESETAGKEKKMFYDAGAFNPYKAFTEYTQADSASNEGLRPVASFYIHVMYRQNASMQGCIVWIDTKNEAHFRSAMELLYLLQSAIKLAGSASPMTVGIRK
ncbi:MAG: hypothetical protein VB071_08435 [Lawsonibacter sp.]|nr:hypothetical protein [Lawsonibacter sp.]